MTHHYTKLLVFLAFILMIRNANCQSIGIRGGLSVSSIDDKGIEFRNLLGPAMGAYFSFGTLTVTQAELNYEQKGVTHLSPTGDISLKLNYVTVPLLFGVDISFAYLKLGTYWGYLANASASGEDVSSQLKSQDLGLVYCGGIRQSLTKKLWLELDARFNQGLLNINKSNAMGEFSNQSYSFQLGLVYKL